MSNTIASTCLYNSMFTRLPPIVNYHQHYLRPDSTSSSSCIICVGSTGAGKSSTIARYTGSSVRSGGGVDQVTEHCQLWPDTNHWEPESPVWVDTVGWEDRHSDNTDTFQVRIDFKKNKLSQTMTGLLTFLFRFDFQETFSCAYNSKNTYLCNAKFHINIMMLIHNK